MAAIQDGDMKDAKPRQYDCYLASDFVDKMNHITTQLPDGRWVPARPLNYQYDTFWKRLKQAWLLLSRKIDGVEWDGQ